MCGEWWENITPFHACVAGFMLWELQVNGFLGFSKMRMKLFVASLVNEGRSVVHARTGV